MFDVIPVYIAHVRAVSFFSFDVANIYFEFEIVT